MAAAPVRDIFTYIGQVEANKTPGEVQKVIRLAHLINFVSSEPLAPQFISESNFPALCDKMRDVLKEEKLRQRVSEIFFAQMDLEAKETAQKNPPLVFSSMDTPEDIVAKIRSHEKRNQILRDLISILYNLVPPSRRIQDQIDLNSVSASLVLRDPDFEATAKKMLAWVAQRADERKKLIQKALKELPPL